MNEKICGDNYYLNEVVSILTLAETYQEKRNEVLCTFDEIGNVKERISQPMFVFAHISIPHKPFVFDENGDSQMIDYNDLDGLEQIFEDNKNQISCIVLEPTVYDFPKKIRTFSLVMKKPGHKQFPFLIIFSFCQFCSEKSK